MNMEKLLEVGIHGTPYSHCTETSPVKLAYISV